MNQANQGGAKAGARDWVLVVDDDQPLRELVGEQLTSLDLDVIGASNGEGALLVVDRQPQPPLLAMVDVLMPGMDGLTLARKLTARLKGRTKIAIISGHLNDASFWPVDLRELTFLPKPFRLADLMALVADARAEREAGD